jgi:hypothetical protein
VGRSRRGPIVVGLPTDAASADGLPDASGRETYFGPRTLGKDGTLEEPVGVIITGVPRAGRDSDEAVARLLRERPTNPLPPAADLSDGLPARAPAPIPPLAASQQSSSEPVQPHRVRTQLERPSERNPVGTIAEGWYRVSGGVVYVEDLQGRPLGSHTLRPGEDAEAIARRILNQKSSGASQFYGPINYPLECTEGPPLSFGDPPPRVVLTGGASLPDSTRGVGESFQPFNAAIHCSGRPRVGGLPHTNGSA